MKPRENTITHSGSLGGNRTAMGFDPDSLPHLINILTEQYSDAALAVIREYSTNALDSHVEAGNPNPIEITLPNRFTPTYVVKDQGVGLSADQIRNQFALYGWSSKRESNDAVGRLGIGCKSGLAYTGQFTLSSVKDGRKINVLVTREDNGGGAVEVVNEIDTDEPNGVTISVPVKYVDEFNRKAHKFFGFWAPGTVLLNGEEPETHDIGDRIIRFDESVYLTPHLDYDYIVMGNVAYPVEYEHEFGLPHGYNAVCYVNIGDVEFAPSREALKYEPETVETLDLAKGWVKDASFRMAQDAVNAAADQADAFEIALRWRKALSYSEVRRLRYQGVEVPIDAAVHGIFWSVRKNGSTYQRAEHSSVAASSLTGYTVITGFRKSNITRGLKDSIVAHFAGDNVSNQRVLLTATVSPWFTKGVNIVPLEKIKPVKTERKATENVRRYRTINRDGVLEADLPTHTRKVVVGTGIVARNDTLYWDAAARVQESGDLLLLVNANRIEAFFKAHPTAIKLADWVTEQHTKALKRFTPLQAVLALDGVPYDFNLAGLDPNNILDPDLRQYVTISKDTNIRQRSRTLTILERIGYTVGLSLTHDAALKQALKDGQALVQTLKKRYPLCTSVGAYSNEKDAATDYVNTFYTLRYSPQATTTSKGTAQ